MNKICSQLFLRELVPHVQKYALHEPQAVCTDRPLGRNFALCQSEIRLMFLAFSTTSPAQPSTQFAARDQVPASECRSIRLDLAAAGKFGETLLLRLVT